MKNNIRSSTRTKNYLETLSPQELMNLGWSLNNEIGLMLQELYYVGKLKQDIANDLAAMAEREEGIDVIKKYISSLAKSK